MKGKIVFKREIEDWQTPKIYGRESEEYKEVEVFLR